MTFSRAQSLRAATKATAQQPQPTTTKMSTRPTNRGGESIEQRLKVIKWLYDT